MKRISRIFLFGALTVTLLAAACAPAEGTPTLPPGQGDLTGSPTAFATDTTGTAETTTATADTSQATATNTTQTPSIPVTGLEIISLDCQYCVDNIAHAQLLIPRKATFEVVSPEELASTSRESNGDDDNNGGDDDNGQARRLTAQLSGAAEAPGPGDPDGDGTATIRVRREQREVCFELSVSNIEPATAAHIHEGAEGVAGPVVVTLDPPPTEGDSSGCVSDVDAALIQNILQNPEQYYVNVHNEEFPDGAIRGQLGRGNDDDNGDDDNGDRLGCKTVDRFRDKKLILCRAEENTTIILNVCLDDNCTEVQITLQSCTPTTGTPSPVATITTTTTATATTATPTPTPAPITATVTATSTPLPPTTGTPTPTGVTNTPIASPTSTPTAATSTTTSTPTP